MRQKQRIYSVFFLLLIISFFLFIISPSRPFLFLQGIVERVFSPLRQSVYTAFHLPYVGEKAEIEKLQKENTALTKQLVDQTLLKKDNEALHDQFAIETITSTKLLPARIVGVHGALPGSSVTQIVIDKGVADGIKKGMAVISNDILIGSVSNASNHLADIALSMNEKTSFTAKTRKTNAIGILKGASDEMILDQVLLSDSLEVNDVVITKGDMTSDGRGYPPDLIIGKIVAVNKKPSALFQSARVAPIIDITRLSIVFVVVGK